MTALLTSSSLLAPTVLPLRVPAAEVTNLEAVAPMHRGTIRSAPALPALAALGIRPGKVCTVLTRLPCGGPIVCAVDERQVALERSLAAQVMLIVDQR